MSVIIMTSHTELGETEIWSGNIFCRFGVSVEVQVPTHSLVLNLEFGG